MTAIVSRKILKNLGWLSGGHVCSALIALPVGIMVARYLGPEKFGILNYAQALVGLFLPLASLGLGSIVVRDLVRERDSAAETLGAAFSLQVIGASLVTVLALGAICILRPDQPIVQLVVMIAALRNVVAAFQVIDFWFQSKVESHNVVVAKMIATMVVAGAKLLLVFLKAPLIAFAIATAFESILLAAFLCYAYRITNQSLLQWKSTKSRMRELLYESWPLTAAGLAIVIQAYIDQVMLGQMLGDESVGQYSVAIRLIAAVAFLPAAIQKSWAPSVTAAKELGQEAYDRRLSQLYQLMFAVFLIQGIPVFFLAGAIVRFLYGVEYSEAGVLLSLLAIRLLFASFGVARTVFITNESLFRHSMVTAVAGSIVNVVANYLLIPHYGARGAIVATVLSFTVTTFLIDAFVPSTRRNFQLMIGSPLAGFSSVMRFLATRAGRRS